MDAQRRRVSGNSNVLTDSTALMRGHLERSGSGKVRDTYFLDRGRLLIVTTDRISAFDSILPDGIPFKGVVLTQMSNFWFGHTQNVVPNHLVSTSIEELFERGILPDNEAYRNALSDRSIIVKHAMPIKFECVVRGYLTGSGLKDYKQTGSVCGIKLPEGLQEASRLEEPIFTPATKSNTGHDENVPFSQVEKTYGKEWAHKLRSISLKLYTTAAEYARERGIIIADTKFEFGRIGRTLILIDEILTPDSSRFWPAATYMPGVAQKSFDKQLVRDWLTNEAHWNKEPPAPRLPAEVIEMTTKRYIEAYTRLTGQEASVLLRSA
jgi:phosphoribosylaminoimidazole-succinocarboxamide synthase